MEKYIKVLLVNPPSLTEVPPICEGLSYYEWLKLKNNEYEFIPGELLGCQCIQDYVEKNNIDCNIDILNACVEMHTSIEQTLEKIYKQMPLDIIAFTGPFSVFKEIEYLAQEIKRNYPEVCVVYGQYFASLCYEEILKKYTLFDFICIGYGEVTMSKIIEYKQGRIDIKDIPSVSYKDENNDIVINSIEIKPEKIINTIPTRYDVEKVLQTGLNVSVFCSRGCPYRCSFCATGSLMRKCTVSMPFILRDPISVVDEIEYLYHKFQITRITFVDDTFAANNINAKLQAKEIALEIQKRNIKIQIMIDTRIDCIDEELFEILKQAGVVKAFIGIEAANNDNLQEYNKGYKKDIILEKVKILEKMGIEIVPGFITFNPDSTLETIKANVNLIKEIPNYDPSMLTYEYIPYPGTDLTNRFIEEGLVIGDFPNYENKYRMQEVKLVKEFYDRLLSKYSVFLINKSKKSKFNIKDYPVIYDKLRNLFVNYFMSIVRLIEIEKIHLLEDNYLTYNKKLKELLKEILMMEIRK